MNMHNIVQVAKVLIYSLRHCGSVPLHSPLIKHVLLWSPTRTNPIEQLYVAMEFKVRKPTITSPLLGFVSTGQSITMDTKNNNEKMYTWTNTYCMLLISCIVIYIHGGLNLKQ